MFQSATNKLIALLTSFSSFAFAAVVLLAGSAFGAETARPVRSEYDVLRSFPPGRLADLCSGDKPDAKGLPGGNRGNGSGLEAGPQRGSCRAVIAVVAGRETVDDMMRNRAVLTHPVGESLCLFGDVRGRSVESEAACAHFLQTNHTKAGSDNEADALRYLIATKLRAQTEEAGGVVINNQFSEPVHDGTPLQPE